MTNTEIIANTLKARGMTDDQLQQLLTAYNGDLPFHTIPEWSRRGYHVKAEEKPLFDCYLWKHTSKPSRAAIEAAQEAGEDVPENSPHFYKKLSNIYSFAQVEKNAPAPVPGPWKKCSFYTIRRNNNGKPAPERMDGYTDGVYNYYATGSKSKQWHAIHPVYGLSVAYESTRQAAQARALELSESVRKLEAQKDARLQAYADAIRAAQDGGNLSLF